jgi:hypothetical protein
VTLPRLLLLLLLAFACAQALLPSVRSGASSDELLPIAVERSVTRLGREGGFDEEAAAPSDVGALLGPTARALQGMGMGERVEALELAANRAAERATAELGPWLREEAARFVPPDSEDGAPDAATAAFRAAVEPALEERLRGVVERGVADAGVPEALDGVRTSAARLPLPRDVSLDPVALVSDRMRSAFFRVLADEEARLRASERDDA